MSEQILIGLAGIITLGIAAQWLSWLVRRPSILLLLLAGFVTGPATGLLNPDLLFGDLLLPLVSVSVAIILFEGGLSLCLTELRETGGVLRNLITVDALVTWLLSAGAAALILDMEAPLAILLGAIVVVSGPTVVGPLLCHERPRGRLTPILK